MSERLKAKDVLRTGWASLSVRADEQPYSSATFSGPAAILTENIGQPTALHHGSGSPRMDQPP